MVKEIVKDVDILTQKSEDFVFGEDDPIIKDLIDTANAHKDICAGLAAVQIGYHKRAFVVWSADKKRFVPFINPKIIKRDGNVYKTVEGCLSVEGEHEVKRYDSIRIVYYNPKGKCIAIGTSGYFAEIIQHECDHLNGVLI